MSSCQNAECKQLTTIKFGVYDAVLRYNESNIEKCRVLQSLGTNPKKITFTAMNSLDLEQIGNRENEIDKKARQLRNLKTRKQNEENEDDFDYSVGMYSFIKVIGATVAMLSKQSGGTTVINKIDNFSRLLPKSGNFLICPISLESLLALIQVGSRGETAKQISIGLKLPISTQRLLETYLALYPLEKTDDHYQLKTFRKLFFNNTFHISSTYRDEAVKYFHVDIQNLSLLPAPKALRTFNNWLNECTESSLQNDLLNTNTLTKETRAIFGNIVSLKGVWVSGFQKNPTLKRKFFIDAHHYVEIEMIDIVSKFNYFQNEKIRAKFLEITYENSDSSLNVVLPYDINGLSNVETSIQTIIHETNFRQMIVNVRVPKMELKTVIPFNNILQQLGIKKAFQDNADLSLISDVNEEKLRIGGVMQETYIKMEEKGQSNNFSVTIPRNTPMPEYVTFYLNHPFILFLKDKQKGVFFMGRFVQPEGQVLTGSYQEEMAKI